MWAGNQNILQLWKMGILEFENMNCLQVNGNGATSHCI